MASWICGVIKEDRMRNEYIRSNVDITSIESKMRENTQKWFYYMMWREESKTVRMVIKQTQKEREEEEDRLRDVQARLKLICRWPVYERIMWGIGSNGNLGRWRPILNSFVKAKRKKIIEKNSENLNKATFTFVRERLFFNSCSIDF